MATDPTDRKTLLKKYRPTFGFVINAAKFSSVGVKMNFGG